MKKRLLTLLLCAAMTTSLMPAYAFAGEANAASLQEETETETVSDEDVTVTEPDGDDPAAISDGEEPGANTGNEDPSAPSGGEESDTGVTAAPAGTEEPGVSSDEEGNGTTSDEAEVAEPSDEEDFDEDDSEESVEGITDEEAAETAETGEVQVNPAAAADDIASGVCRNVPWRITSSNELIFGAEGSTYTFEYDETGDPGRYTFGPYRSTIESCRFAGTVNGNGSHDGMFEGFYALREIDLSGFHTNNLT